LSFTKKLTQGCGEDGMDLFLDVEMVQLIVLLAACIGMLVTLRY
jgi:hypothetical protein